MRPGVALRIHDGDLRITTAGTVVERLDVRGRIIVQAPDVTIRDSIVRGPAGGMTAPGYLIANWGNANLRVIDTEIVATVPSGYVNGVVGNNYTLTRVEIRNVIDSANILGDNVTIEGSWLHDNLYYENDPLWNGSPSHSDSIQVQNGSGIRIVRNTIESGRNAGLMITQDRGQVADIAFIGNMADGGTCTVNIAQKSYGPPQGVVIVDNSFGRNTRLQNCAVIASDSTRAAMRFANNFYVPDNAPVTVRRGG